MWCMVTQCPPVAMVMQWPSSCHGDAMPSSCHGERCYGIGDLFPVPSPPPVWSKGRFHTHTAWCVCVSLVAVPVTQLHAMLYRHQYYTLGRERREGGGREEGGRREGGKERREKRERKEGENCRLKGSVCVAH